jgi:hypothetical protein
MPDNTLTVFIHYSWDNEIHKNWVLNLANRLVSDGVDVFFDRFDLSIGSNNNYFMEKISHADKVIIIMTKKYKKKADEREGGAGFEYHIISNEIAKSLKGNNKFIPILREQTSSESTPILLQGMLYHDMSEDEIFEVNYLELLRIILNKPQIIKPKLGKIPDFDSLDSTINNVDKLPIKFHSSRIEVRDVLGVPQEEARFYEIYWSHGIEVYYNRHEDFADGFVIKRLESGIQYEDKILGIKLGDTFAKVKSILGNPLNWGIPNPHTSIAFYHIDKHFLALSIWRKSPDEPVPDFIIGSVYEISYCEEGSLLACEPMTALAIEDIRQKRDISFHEGNNLEGVIDFNADFFKEEYFMFPPEYGAMGGYTVLVVFLESMKEIEFWFYDLGWSSMVIRTIYDRDLFQKKMDAMRENRI